MFRAAQREGRQAADIHVGVARLDHGPVVARGFALERDRAQHEHDGRVEEQHRLHETFDRVPPGVIAANVRELVEQDAFEVFAARGGELGGNDHGRSDEPERQRHRNIRRGEHPHAAASRPTACCAARVAPAAARRPRSEREDEDAAQPNARERENDAVAGRNANDCGAATAGAHRRRAAGALRSVIASPASLACCARTVENVVASGTATSAIGCLATRGTASSR